MGAKFPKPIRDADRLRQWQTATDRLARPRLRLPSPRLQVVVEEDAVRVELPADLPEPVVPGELRAEMIRRRLVQLAPVRAAAVFGEQGMTTVEEIPQWLARLGGDR